MPFVDMRNNAMIPLAGFILRCTSYHDDDLKAAQT